MTKDPAAKNARNSESEASQNPISLSDLELAAFFAIPAMVAVIATYFLAPALLTQLFPYHTSFIRSAWALFAAIFPM